MEATWPGISAHEEFASYGFPLYERESLLNHAPRLDMDGLDLLAKLLCVSTRTGVLPGVLPGILTGVLTGSCPSYMSTVGIISESCPVCMNTVGVLRSVVSVQCLDAHWGTHCECSA